MARDRIYRQIEKFNSDYKHIRFLMPPEGDRKLAIDLASSQVGHRFTTKNKYENKWVQKSGKSISINKMNTFHIFSAMCHCIMYNKYLYALEDLETEWEYRKKYQKLQMEIDGKRRAVARSMSQDNNIFTTTNVTIA